MKTLPALKLGDTFQVGCVAKDADGMPEDLSGVVLRAQARNATNGALIHEFTVDVADQGTHPGAFALAASTAGWPIGAALIDIQSTIGSVVVSSETLRLPVIEDVTHD